MRALVIDDRNDVQLIIQSGLAKRLHWQVFSAASVHDGLKLASAEQPDVILLAAELLTHPESIDSLKLLRTLPSTQSIPIILLANRARIRDELRFRELGIAAVIAQPFDPIRLPEQIAAALNETSSQ